jgi:nucleoside-diphosphate-sugar epimerase
MTYLVTGAAGFKGDFITQRLYQWGADVIGFGNHNDYQINVTDTIYLRVCR